MSTTAKGRPCPAAGRQITAAECGENRASRYACPAECPFNPFSPAHYDLFSPIEAGVIRKSLDWFVRSAPNQAERERDLERLEAKSPLERFAWQLGEFFHRKDAGGQTCAQRWLAAGLPGLKNDERVIARAAMQTRLRLIEVHRVRDDRQVEAVDLLEESPEPFLICDRSLAAGACRFSTFVAWFFPLPHFWRSMGMAVALPPLPSFEAPEVLSQFVRHLGGPQDRAAWNQWFPWNFAKFAQALEAFVSARRRQFLDSIDAEFGKAVYQLRAPFAQCRETLDKIEAVSTDPLTDQESMEGFAEARVWFDESPEVEMGGSVRPFLGRVLLGQTYWRLETMGGKKLDVLRPLFEAAFGQRMQFVGERRDNLADRLKSKEPKYDAALIPPGLLEEPSKIILTSSRAPAPDPSAAPEDTLASLNAQYDRQWLDSPVPALGGHTPRQAAPDPVLRPKLVRLLKDRVRASDERDLETGRRNDDPNWLLEELGLREIIFESPPPRPPAEEPTRRLKPWPSLPAQPFTRDEAAKRLLGGMKQFESLADAVAAMKDAGGHLTEDISEVVGEMLTPQEHQVLAASLVQTWFAFIPPGSYGPDLSTKEICQAFGNVLQSWETAAKAGPEESTRFLIDTGPQPHLLFVLGAQLVAERDRYRSGRRRLRANAWPLMLAILKTIVGLLDSKCRAPSA